MPTLSNVLNLPLNNMTEETQQVRTRQHCVQETEKGFKIWKPGNQILPNENRQASLALETELSKRKIRCDEREDVLRWGYQPKGAFTTSEAYKLICNDSAPPRI